MTLLNLFLWPFLLPLLLLAYLLWPKSRPHFSERLGFWPMRAGESGVLLFHVASLGEARAASRLIGALSRKRPLLLTTMTQTGRSALKAAHPEIPSGLAPLDLPGLWRPFLKGRRIRGILLFETEVWPAMILEASRAGIPVGLVNARLSSTSYRRYKALRFLFAPLFRRLSPVLAQSDLDAGRFIDLGVAPDALVRTGNLKWDLDPASLDPARLQGADLWLERTGPEPRPFLLCGASVHPDEAVLLWNACQTLVRSGIPVQCLLAPRHLDRLPEILEKIPEAGISLRTTGRTGSGKEGPLFLLDTYGELGAMLAFSDAVFVGGTLVPVGGHSPVEAAFHGKPLLWGPHRDHISDLAQGLIQAEAAIEVSGLADLSAALFRLVRDPSQREAMGRRSRETFLRESGPMDRTLAALDPFLRSLGDPLP